MVRPIPEGFHTVTPYLTIRGTGEALEFYEKAFGAVEESRQEGPDGRLIHAHIRIGDSPVMMSEEFPEYGAHSPLGLGGSPVTIHLYFEDVDAAWKRAVDAGAEVTMELADQFWGDRFGQLKDPFGHRWSLGQHVEDVSPEEADRRAREFFAQEG